MNSLYWKIFLSFWISTSLLVTGTALIVRDISPADHERISKQRGTPLKSLAEVSKKGESSSPDVFKRWVRQQDKSLYDRLFIIDQSLQEVFGRKVSPSILKKLPTGKNWKYSRAKYRTHNGVQYFEKTFSTKTKEYFTAILVIPTHSGLINRLIKERFWIILIVSTVISGLICYFLAHYLTKPIERLRLAARAISAGDLSVRTYPEMANRRDEISDLAADFDKMALAVEKAMADQRRLIKDVSHELRSPIARLQIALALTQKKASPQLHPELERIDSEVGKLNRMIQQILTIPLYESEQAQPLADVVDLVAMLETIIEDLEYERGERHCILFEHQLEEALLYSTGDLLAGALHNILSNALRFSPPKHPVNVEISASYHEQQASWCIKVRDSGPGIPEEALKDVFKAFYRVSSARERTSGGHGLGLAIAERAIALHNGHISAVNCQPSGLQVEIILPNPMMPTPSIQLADNCI